MSDRHPAFTAEQWEEILAERERNRAKLAGNADAQDELARIGWRRQAIALETSRVGERLRKIAELKAETQRAGATAVAMAEAHAALLDDLRVVLNRADSHLIDAHNAIIAEATA